MASKQWTISLDDKDHTVELEHGFWSGKRTIRVDGEPLPKLKSKLFDLGGEYPFNLAGHACAVRIIPRPSWKYKYDLVVDGRSEETGESAVPFSRYMMKFAVLSVVIVSLIGLVGGIGVAELEHVLFYDGAWRPEMGGRESRLDDTAAWEAIAEAERPRTTQLLETVDALRPLHSKLGLPEPGDWLYYTKEEGQTFLEYLQTESDKLDASRHTIYIQPIGEFNSAQREVLERTIEFIRHFFGMPVKVMEDLPLDRIPEKARRVHPEWGVKQILANHIAFEVLKPDLPDDAAACLGLTASDLWATGYNFCFGLASLEDRVGIWSFHRKGDPGRGEAAFRDCLKGSIKTACHEIGHIFGIEHCTSYDCLMCGSNNLEEGSRRPLALCPECLAKIAWVTKVDLAKRYEALASFCDAHGFEKEAAFFQASRERLRAAGSP